MRKLIVSTMALAVIGTAGAQNVTRNTLITQPGPDCGKDANIGLNMTAAANWENNNYGSDTWIAPYTWTWYANGWTQGSWRSLIDFQDLDLVPQGATVISATLRLYGWPVGTGLADNSGTNEAWVQRINSAWNENTVTWNTQPGIDPNNWATIPTVGPNYNAAVNVTAMTQAMVNLPASGRHGFRLISKVETTYKFLGFYSSDHTVPSLRPQLEVVYEYNCGGIATLQTTSIPLGDTQEQLNEMSTLDAFPNPSTGAVTLGFQSPVKTSAVITVADLGGKVVKTVTIEAEEGNNRYMLDLSGQLRGNYLVSIQLEKGMNLPLEQQVVIE